MAKSNANLITAIDLGSAKTCAIVAEITDAGLKYRGHGVVESRGTRKGMIVDLEKTVATVRKAVLNAEGLAEEQVERAVVGIAGPHIRAVGSQGGITLSSRPREVTRDDVRLAVEKARGALALPADYEPLHYLVRQYMTDDQGGIQDPLGMIARSLHVEFCVVVVNASARQNVVTALNLAGVQVDGIILEQLAPADFILTADERELGVCLMDIGAGTTDLMVYEEGAVEHVGVVRIGGDHFTKDLAVYLPTPVAEAERLKRGYGNAVVTMVPEVNEVEVPSVGEKPPTFRRQREIAEPLEARAQDMAKAIRNHLREAGVMEKCRAGFVLTGGGARLNGLSEILGQYLTDDNGHSRPIRISAAPVISRLPVELAGPEYATAMGMLLYAYRTRVLRPGGDAPTLKEKLLALFTR